MLSSICHYIEGYRFSCSLNRRECCLDGWLNMEESMEPCPHVVRERKVL